MNIWVIVADLHTFAQGVRMGAQKLLTLEKLCSKIADPFLTS